MDDLTIVSKKIKADEHGSKSKGRPPNETFALRSYNGGNNVIMTILPELLKEGDRIDFYLSNLGFAVKVSPEGDRVISKSHKARTASVPLAVRSMLNIPEGTTKIAFYEHRGGGLYFFPFSQFSKA